MKRLVPGWAARLALPLLLSGLPAAVGAAAPGDEAARVTPPAPRQAAQARLHYMQHCMGCHLPDGSGAPDKGIPDMRDMLGRFLQVPGGREFIVQVPGVMNSDLSDADIARLMNWLLPEFSAPTLPAHTAAYTAAEIAGLRHTRPLDVPAARQALVDRMPFPSAR